MAVCMAVFFGFAALGFDLAYVRYARLQLQNATDAAAHAALVRLRATGNVTTARGMAKAVAAQNNVWGKNLTLVDDDIIFGGWNFTTRTMTTGVSPANAVQVNGLRSTTGGTDGAIALTFGRILGQNSVNLNHYGTAAYRIRSIVLAQDITGSFSDNIDDARDATVSMLNALRSYNIPADRIGMQLFTGDGTQFTPLTNLSTGYAAVRSQWLGDGKASADPTKTSGITLCNKLDVDPGADAPWNHGWVPACSSGGDGTNQGAAIRRSMDQLLAQSQPYETRVIVLVTDGNAMCCGAGGCTATNACALARAQYGVTMANAAADAGISIFTVSFGADPDQHLYNKSLARGIGTAHDTPNASELASILTIIAGRIPIALVR